VALDQSFGGHTGAGDDRFNFTAFGVSALKRASR
jgi:hypothetical protein